MFDKQVYSERRNALHKVIGSGIAIFPGNSNLPYNYKANIFRFRQDSTFMYYFGLPMPGFFGIMDFDEGKDIIFGDDITIEDIIWMGEQPSVAELAFSVGVNDTLNSEKLIYYIKDAISKNRKVHFLSQYRSESIIKLSELLGIPLNNVNAGLSRELTTAVVEQRLVKSSVEIDHIDSIMDVAYEMHTTAMRMAKNGVFEQELVGAMEGIAVSHGGYVSFPIILSKHGEILHNENHSNRLADGDLLLVDGGFDSPLGYATDHTRTFPVGGNFSTRQQDIYEIVLRANNAVHENARPGIKYRDMHFLACTTIARGLKEIGLMKGDVNEAVNAGAHTLFMPHGLGHAMGMDVHDMENLGEDFVGYAGEFKRSTAFGTAYLRFARTLKPGYVMTNEPGIYFIPALIDKWKGESLHAEFINYDKIDDYRSFGGVRLEDDMLVTNDGIRNLGKRRIPIYPDELKKIIGKA
ncbi:MAG: aminopeptidase P family protein [Saprospiraceae bacterium]|nr:aminopeptidase P family protein [Saprospiraceae bacterium]